MKYKLYCPFLLGCLFLTVSSFATDYFFIGNGDWNVAANWKDGLIPPEPATANHVIYINGTARTSGNTGTFASPTCGMSCNYFGDVAGTLIVSVGGTLTLNNTTQFSNGGSIIVNGTLINKTTYQGFMTGTLTINGTVINQGGGFVLGGVFGNQGIITVNSGGTLRNEAGLLNNDMDANKGTIVVNSGGTLQNIAPAIFKLGKVNNNGGAIISSANLSGNANITGSLEDSGTLAPGNSPGVYTIGGNYTATATAVHNFEVGGTGSANYDRLNAGGNVYLDGTLNISLINGFVPSLANPDIPIITGTINGTFATVTKPSQYQLVYNSNSVVLRVNTTLPVIFSHVDVKKEGTAAKLTWNIQTESNVLKYEVERSSNGNTYRKVGEVIAASLNQYTYTDAAPQDKNYYRIKSVDRDGKYSYSIVLTYSQGQSSVSLKAFPSPTNTELNIQHPATTAANRIVITATDGRTLQTVFPAAGSQKTTVSLSGLTKGIYLARYFDGSELVGSLTFVKK